MSGFQEPDVGNVDTDILLDPEDMPDLPTCKVSATADPAGLLRFDVAEGYAESLLEQVGSTLDSHDDEDSLVDVTFLMDRPAYLSLTNGLRQLQTVDGLAIKQVMPAEADPDISILVAINESQIQSSLAKNRQAASLIGRNDMCGQRFSVSPAGARLLCTQLAAALGGHDEPLEVVKDD